SVNANPFDLLIVLVSGLAGFALRYNNVPLAPVVIGFVLGPMIEQSLRQCLILTDESFLAFFVRPLAVVLFVLTAACMAWPSIRGRLARRRADRGGAPRDRSEELEVS